MAELKRLLGIGVAETRQTEENIQPEPRQVQSPLHTTGENEKLDSVTTQQNDSHGNGDDSADVPLHLSVGWKMLEKMGWKNGMGVGKSGEGRLDPVIAGDESNYGFKGAGIRHASEVTSLEKSKRPQDLESWEREEKTEDWFKGSKSSMWLPAGLLEDQDKNDSSTGVGGLWPTITTYKDAWDDKQVSELVMADGVSNADGDWEENWEASLGRELDAETLNTEHFFSCTVILGSRVRLVRVEPTGEVFQHILWAHDSRSLRAALELHGSIRVLRPIVKGTAAQQRCVYGILARGADLPANLEAERLQGMKVYGPMWMLCRSSGRYVRDYELTDYLQDFIEGSSAA